MHELLQSFKYQFSLLDAYLFESVTLVQESEHVGGHCVLRSTQLHLGNIVLLFGCHHLVDRILELFQGKFFLLDLLSTAK